MTRPDFDRLREAARTLLEETEAPPPWITVAWIQNAADVISKPTGQIICESASHAEAAHIAACDPQTILAVCDWERAQAERIAELEGRIERAKAAVLLALEHQSETSPDDGYPFPVEVLGRAATILRGDDTGDRDDG